MAQKIDYELTDAEALVLLNGTQQALGEAGALGAGSAGARGGRAGARLTRAQTAVTTFELPMDPDEVRRRAAAVVAEMGVAIDDPNAAGDGSVWGLVPSGAGNLTVALIRVGVRAAVAGGATVEVRGIGREGLIKQRIGAKAADRIAARLSG